MTGPATRVDPAFHRYVGIDYSGAETPTSSLRGLRVYLGDREKDPAEVPPPPGPKKHWTRKVVAEWLADILEENSPTVVGIDHGFSFPLKYFEAHRLPLDWDTLLEDFHRHWPTDGDHAYVDFVRDGTLGNGAARKGNSRWRRLTEVRAGGAKSVFHFDCPGSVAKSTHAGTPWLLFLRRRLGARVHFWPFDGWVIPHDRSTLVEVYPRLWSSGFPRDGRDDHQHDAYATAAHLREADLDGRLTALFAPSLTEDERIVARAEGWILGVR